MTIEWHADENSRTRWNARKVTTLLCTTTLQTDPITRGVREWFWFPFPPIPVKQFPFSTPGNGNRNDSYSHSQEYRFSLPFPKQVSSHSLPIYPASRNIYLEFHHFSFTLIQSTRHHFSLYAAPNAAPSTISKHQFSDWVMSEVHVRESGQKLLLCSVQYGSFTILMLSILIPSRGVARNLIWGYTF